MRPSPSTLGPAGFLAGMGALFFAVWIAWFRGAKSAYFEACTDDLDCWFH